MTAGRTSFAQRSVERLSAALAGAGMSRRGFLARAAVLASALVVDPVDFVLRPQTAYATVCGEANECAAGWSAFCCTINDGANTCPPGSFAAGWWKVDDSEFCDGGARYYVDCNRDPDASCECTCGDGPCDRRRVCCNTFRYGQCNQQVAGVTEVVCRIVLCTPPWEWDDACSRTVRTAEVTRTHTASCLPERGASPIAIKYQDLGLVGSVLGAQVGAEAAGPDGGRIANYERGLIAWSERTGAHEIHEPLATRYVELGGAASVLGYPVSDVEPVGEVDPAAISRFASGALWLTPGREVWETTGAIHDVYAAEGGATGWLGFPRSGVYEMEGPTPRRRSDFAAGWSIVVDDSTGERRILPSDTPLPEEGWPDTVRVDRWAGRDRFDTAAAVSRASFEPGTAVVHVARGDEFADALAAGAAAGLVGGPVLLVAPSSLPASTSEELRRLAPERIVVVGAEAAVGDSVVEAMRRLTGSEVLRRAGATRFDTAAALSAATFVPEVVETVWIATGRGFADALGGTVPAALGGGPLLLVDTDAIPPATDAELRRLRPARIVVLGGPGAVAESVAGELSRFASGAVQRIAGTDRYRTAAAVSQAAFPDGAEAVVVATGVSFPDGLGAGPAAVRRRAPVLLVTPRDIPTATDRELRRLGPGTIHIAGGRTAVSGEVVARLERYPASQT